MKPAFRRFSAVELIVVLLTLFVIAPFVDELPHGEVIVACLIALGLIASVLAVAGRTWRLLVAWWLALQVVGARALAHFRPDLVSASITYFAALIFCGFVVVNLLRFVLKAPRVDAEVLCAAVAAYMLSGLSWSAAYLLAAQGRPDAFMFSNAHEANHVMSTFEAFYFSLVTLTTVGYGDITPVSRVARMLAAMEAQFGLLYVAVLIARLVSVYSAPQRSEPSDDS